MSKSANLTLTKDWACFNLLASSWPSPWPPPPAATSLDLDLSTFRLTTFHECVDSNNDVGFHFQKYLRCSLPNEERVKFFFSLPNEDLLFHLAKNVSYAFSNTQKLYEGKNSKRIFVRCSLRGWCWNCDSFVRLGRRRYNFVVARKVCACQHFFSTSSSLKYAQTTLFVAMKWNVGNGYSTQGKYLPTQLKLPRTDTSCFARFARPICWWWINAKKSSFLFLISF